MTGRTVIETRPRGRQEITAAIIDAATKLFADRGPSAVTLRDVARGADVTLSQIHRHVGNKEALIAAVLRADLEANSDEGLPTEDVDLAAWLRMTFHARFPADLRTRLHGRIILDGFDLPDLQDRYPGIELTIHLLRSSLPEEEAQVRAALLTSFFAGWQLFGETYLTTTGAGPIDPDRFAAIIAPVLDALAKAPPAKG